MRWRAPNLTADELAMLDQIDALHEIEAIHGSYSHAERLEWEARLARDLARKERRPDTGEEPRPAKKAPRRKGPATP